MTYIGLFTPSTMKTSPAIVSPPLKPNHDRHQAAFSLFLTLVENNMFVFDRKKKLRREQHSEKDEATSFPS